MSSARLPLTALKVREIQHLASAIGSISSKSKKSHVAELPQICHTSLFPQRRSAKTHRILSVDMGIQNLAYAVLDVNEGAFSPSPEENSTESLLHTRPKLIEKSSILQRVDLVAWDRFRAETSTAMYVLEEVKPENPWSNTFDPAYFARLAYRIVRGVFLPYAPSVILIERQRYRSGNAPAVLEWTIRVNMFECALHAALEALSHQVFDTPKPDEGGRDVGSEPFPSVFSVDPGRVTQFWVPKARRAVAEEQEKHEQQAGNSNGSDNKRNAATEKYAKVMVAASWLPMLHCSQPQAMEVSEEFQRVISRRKGLDSTGESREKTKETHERPRLKKLDDLADCLLQGMAWVQWERNRRLAQELFDFDGKSPDESAPK